MAQKTGLQFTFEVEGLDPAMFALVDFTGDDSLSMPFCFSISLASRSEEVSAEQVVDKNAILTIWKNGEMYQQWYGIVSRFSKGDTGYHHTFYRVEFVPPVARLALRQNCRIFQQQAAPEIISILLQEMGITDYSFSLTRDYAKREFCVQYRESDLTFINRLAAEEGLIYRFAHNGGKNTVVFFDDNRQVPALKYPLPYNNMSGGTFEGHYIRALKRFSRIETSSVVFQDNSFKNPNYRFAQQANAAGANYQQQIYEYFDFPGRYKNDAIGKLFASYKLQALRNNAVSAEAQSNVTGLIAGAKFTMQDHLDDACNDEWFITHVSHKGTQPQALEEAGGTGETTYNNRFSIIPARQTWRALCHDKPLVNGDQVARVVGPEGEEIYCDEYGRIKILLPWDRYSDSNDKASCWVRVAQEWAGSQYGTMVLPRVGHEVIVSFIEGDPDQPIVTGRAYNAMNQPPYALPANKTRTVLRTESHQGEGYNELRFEDQAGSEEIHVHAQKDMNVMVENDHLSKIKHQKHTEIGNDKYEHIKAGDHKTVDAEHRQHIKKNNSVVSDKSWHLQTGKKWLCDAGNEIHLKSGVKMTFEAGSEITLKAAGSFVKIDGSGVMVCGPAIGLNAGGSPGTGSAYAGKMPKMPGEVEQAIEFELPEITEIRHQLKAKQAKLKYASDPSTQALINRQLEALSSKQPLSEECGEPEDGEAK